MRAVMAASGRHAIHISLCDAMVDNPAMAPVIASQMEADRQEAIAREMIAQRQAQSRTR